MTENNEYCTPHEVSRLLNNALDSGKEVKLKGELVMEFGTLAITFHLPPADKNYTPIGNMMENYIDEY